MRITIDDRQIEAREGASVLDAALEAGIFIPHLCSHPDLEKKGGCRLCSVEIEGEDKAVPACMTPVSFSGRSVWPWTRLLRFQSVCPCLTRTNLMSILLFLIRRRKRSSHPA